MADQALDKTALGAGVYTESVITLLYQRVVLGFNFPYLWRCPVEVMLPYFRENFSKRHLDCGVANGYFCGEALATASWPTSEQHVTLLDLNPNSLKYSKDVILKRAPDAEVRCVEADIRAPVPTELQSAQFDSITMFNLFHCVPGAHKFHQGLKHYGQLLAPGGVLSGCTILGGPHVRGIGAWLNMCLYNWLGIFQNWDDTEEKVTSALHQEFDEVETRLVGMVLLFKASSKK